MVYGLKMKLMILLILLMLKKLMVNILNNVTINQFSEDYNFIKYCC